MPLQRSARHRLRRACDERGSIASSDLQCCRRATMSLEATLVRPGSSAAMRAQTLPRHRCRPCRYRDRPSADPRSRCSRSIAARSASRRRALLRRCAGHGGDELREEVREPAAGPPAMTSAEGAPVPVTAMGEAPDADPPEFKIAAMSAGSCGVSGRASNRGRALRALVGFVLFAPIDPALFFVLPAFDEAADRLGALGGVLPRLALGVAIGFRLARRSASAVSRLPPGGP